MGTERLEFRITKITVVTLKMLAIITIFIIQNSDHFVVGM